MDEPPLMATTPTSLASELGSRLGTNRGKIHRTRTGCQTCRNRKIKCDEQKPVCTQCHRGDRTCAWLGVEHKRSRAQRRPNATACDSCRVKKLKCVGSVRDACEKCRTGGIKCLRTRRDSQLGSPALSSGSTAAHEVIEASHSVSSGHDTATPETSQLGERILSQTTNLAQMPQGKELDHFIQLYFASVHHFGYFTFIHPLVFQRLLENSKEPRELTLMMIASAMRFAGPVTPENLARADAWADTAIKALLSHVYQGFGAVQLMAMLLAQHYDLNRGKFTSAWLLGANCTRMMQMMSLHTFDRTYPADFPSHQRLSPLLSREALRRVAWCTFYLDSMTDGGRYGSHTVDERAFRLQLPCDQESFLGNDAVVTEPLIPGQVDFTDLTVDSLPHASLDMSAYLLRTAAARRRTLQFASRASYQEQTVERLSCDCLALQAELEEVVAALPRRLYFNADNMFLHRDRLTTFLLLHVLRENLFIILGRAALQIYLRDPNKADQVIQTRRSRISRALAVAGLVSEGLNANITFDPHIGIHAYVALEILIFEPRRLASAGEPSDPQAPELTGGITLLLTGIRGIAGRSETINHLYAEAVDRLLRCDCAHLLDPGDLTIIRSKHPLVGQDVAEYDFRDHRGAKLERIALGKRVRTGSTHETHDEVLLDDSITRDGRDSSGPSAAPSPKMTALAPSYPVGPHMVDPTQPSGVSTVSNHSTWMGMESYNLAQFGQSWTELIEPENTDHLPSPLNWLFPLDEWADRTAAFSGRFENA